MERAASEAKPADTLWGLALPWIVGTAFSFLAISLAISGRLWDLGFPSWLIMGTVVVGAWQWLWVAPLLVRTKRRNRLGFYRGLLIGAIAFSIVNITGWIVLFVKLRHFSLQ